MPMACIYTGAFSLAAGTADTAVDLDPMDLSRAAWVRMEVELTGDGSGGAAGDTLDIYLQEASDDATPTWDDRIHMPQFLADMTVSAAAPEKRVVQFWCEGIITATDASYEPSGSAGGARLAAGAFIPGRLKGKRRTSVGSVPRHRISYEVTDTDADAPFSGTTRIFISEE